MWVHIGFISRSLSEKVRVCGKFCNQFLRFCQIENQLKKSRCNKRDKLGHCSKDLFQEKKYCRKNWLQNLPCTLYISLIAVCLEICHFATFTQATKSFMTFPPVWQPFNIRIYILLCATTLYISKVEECLESMCFFPFGIRCKSLEQELSLQVAKMKLPVSSSGMYQQILQVVCYKCLLGE